MNKKIISELKEIVVDLIRCKDQLGNESYKVESPNGGESWIRFKLDDSHRVIVSMSYDNIEIRSNVLLHIDAWEEIVKDDNLFSKEIDHIIAGIHDGLHALIQTVDCISEVA